MTLVPSSLSFRLLVLTVFFVMVGEVLIYTPSIARFRMMYLEERLAAAHLAVLAIDAAPDGMVTEQLASQLLDHVGAHKIIANRTSAQMQMLSRPSSPNGDVVLELPSMHWVNMISEAFEALAQPENRVLRITGASPKDSSMILTVVLDEAPLRDAMYDYSWRILRLSLVISAITAACVFLSLRWLMVRPMQRITRSLVTFRDNPEAPGADMDDIDRPDEIGAASRALVEMKAGLRAALRQKARLATLGTAVTKINHDLRNMLATATLISDSLTDSADPRVRKVAPTLTRAIDRAVKLCTQTLDFTQDAASLRAERTVLIDLFSDLRSEFATNEDRELEVRFDQQDGTEISIDRDQMYRVFANLVGNARHAGATLVSLDLAPVDGRVQVRVADDGRGIPEEALDKLFQPFVFSTNQGGSGLGLAISRDIVQAHGGTLTLGRTGPDGTVFVVDIPFERRVEDARVDRVAAA
jgi:signal transduction histidine kinase